jgi:hypothetical protein
MSTCDPASPTEEMIPVVNAVTINGWASIPASTGGRDLVSDETKRNCLARLLQFLRMQFHGTSHPLTHVRTLSKRHNTIKDRIAHACCTTQRISPSVSLLSAVRDCLWTWLHGVRGSTAQVVCELVLQQSQRVHTHWRRQRCALQCCCCCAR